MLAAALLACAATVHPITVEAITRVESSGNPFAINVNHLAGPQPRPASAIEAARIASDYIARGYTVDLGLMQVNNRNLARLGLTIDQVLEPCTNIRAGAAILIADYARAVQAYGEGQAALKAALSAYNTGSFSRGFENGYVARYFGSRGVPALAGGLRQATATVAAVKHAAPPPPPNPYNADSSVFVRTASAGFTIQ